ncbi:hypothetical protein BIV57_07135 [Mangrovactinospora gilvigrisea]|uniref:NlpC/P60 domain-containing protein n=1 Tax=Mangrovactinospora gilvigrisea TaxID=1428644 RepID=A0A1J7BXJ7_9ACTN|nr:C40 family peptidase [Mangrovactinospora gilvigrisea]OIV38209.1 hypothetical protein BIV57_07135 [Mangrovactinospora gilvigrisea]
MNDHSDPRRGTHVGRTAQVRTATRTCRVRGLRGGTAAVLLAAAAATAGAAAAPASAEAAPAVASSRPHYWYLKHGHWYWTSHYDRYRAWVDAGGTGNGTRGPDFSRGSRPAPPPASRPSGRSSSDTARPGARAITATAAGRAIAYARAQLGKPYAWGGNGPRAFDCSGLVQQAYLRAGVRLPRVTAQQAAATTRISASRLRPGDLVHWSNNGKASGAYHIAIYLGGGKYIEAPRPGKKVRITAISWGYKPSFYTRVTVR